MERLETKGDQRSARFEFTVERESGSQVLPSPMLMADLERSFLP